MQVKLVNKFYEICKQKLWQKGFTGHHTQNRISVLKLIMNLEIKTAHYLHFSACFIFALNNIIHKALSVLFGVTDPKTDGRCERTAFSSLWWWLWLVTLLLVSFTVSTLIITLVWWGLVKQPRLLIDTATCSHTIKQNIANDLYEGGGGRRYKAIRNEF